MNKTLYVVFVVGTNIAVFLCSVAVIAADGGISVEEITPVVGPLLVLAAVAHLTFIYRFWSSIRDGNPRMSPGKAIGLLLVPVFNIYWLFQVYGGFATDSNKYVKEKGINAPNLSQGLLVFSAVLILVPIPLLNWIVQTMAISGICKMVNVIHAK